jgi:hypothetical protein
VTVIRESRAVDVARNHAAGGGALGDEPQEQEQEQEQDAPIQAA